MVYGYWLCHVRERNFYSFPRACVLWANVFSNVWTRRFHIHNGENINNILAGKRLAITGSGKNRHLIFIALAQIQLFTNSTSRTSELCGSRQVAPRPVRSENNSGHRAGRRRGGKQHRKPVSSSTKTSVIPHLSLIEEGADEDLSKAEEGGVTPIENHPHSEHVNIPRDSSDRSSGIVFFPSIPEFKESESPPCEDPNPSITPSSDRPSRELELADLSSDA